MFIVFCLLICVAYAFSYNRERIKKGTPITSEDINSGRVRIVQPDNAQIAQAFGYMHDLMRVLRQTYHKPISYEGTTGELKWYEDYYPSTEPIYEGDVDDAGNIKLRVINTVVVNRAREAQFTIPEEMRPNKNKQIDSVLFEKIVDAYQKQAGGPKYKVVSSEWGLHVIADRVRDEKGQWINEKQYLDAVITVPSEKRTALDHIKMLIDTINAQNEIKIHFQFDPTEQNLLWQFEGLQNMSEVVDYLYGRDVSDRPAFEWAKIVKSRTKYDDKFSFAWGANKLVAREALMELLEKANTTLTWRMECEDHPDPTRRCYLTILAMDVCYSTPDGKNQNGYLLYDREKLKK